MKCDVIRYNNGGFVNSGFVYFDISLVWVKGLISTDSMANLSQSLFSKHLKTFIQTKRKKTKWKKVFINLYYDSSRILNGDFSNLKNLTEFHLYIFEFKFIEEY